MQKHPNILIIAISILFLAACNTATTDSKEKTFDLAASRSAIEAQNAKFMEAFKKGDSAAIASYYTKDGMLMPPNEETINSSAIAATWGSFMRMGVAEVKLMADEVTGNEELLAETGKYEIYGADNKMLDKGKYIVLWKPENGEWKLHRDIWNSSMPVAGTK